MNTTNIRLGVLTATEAAEGEADVARDVWEGREVAEDAFWDCDDDTDEAGEDEDNSDGGDFFMFDKTGPYVPYGLQYNDGLLYF